MTENETLLIKGEDKTKSGSRVGGEWTQQKKGRGDFGGRDGREGGKHTEGEEEGRGRREGRKRRSWGREIGRAHV